MKTLVHVIVSLVTLFYFFGCSSSEERKEKKEVKEVKASEIKVSETNDNVRLEVSKHEKELKADNKDFYYALKDKDVKTDVTDETYTRVDAQKRVKNDVKDGKIADRSSSRVDTPYNYIRIDLLKTSLSKNFIVKCSSCHDDYANGIIGPSLLHKDSAFIYDSLVKYKTKEGANVLMQDLVKKMDDGELKEMAEEIAGFNKEVRALKGE